MQATAWANARFVRKIEGGRAASAECHHRSKMFARAQMLHQRRANAAAGAEDDRDPALRERRHQNRRKLVHDFSFPKAFDR